MSEQKTVTQHLLAINMILQKIARNQNLSKLEYVVAGVKKHLPKEDVAELEKDYQKLKAELLKEVEALP